MKGARNYKNLRMAQNQNAEKFFDFLIEKKRPTHILEIGTAQGGLSLLLSDLLTKHNLNNSIIKTYDREEPVYLISTIKKNNIKNIDVNHCNIFDEDIEKLKSFIDQGSPTLVLCDGGSKKTEFNMFAKFLKKEDMIMAHDYAPNKNYFENHVRGKIWNWHEIQDSHIEETCKKENLLRLVPDMSQSAAWVCMIKK